MIKNVKKFLKLINLGLLLIICIACTSFSSKQNSEPIVRVPNQIVKVPKLTVNDLEPKRWNPNRHIEIVTISYRGEKHEYIIMTGYSTLGIAHWEGCKYCKTKVKN